MKRILIIGGYGNFGSRISRALAKEENMRLIIAGRSISRAKQLLSELNSVNKPEAVYLDIKKDISNVFSQIKPDIVIHTSGPFQEQDYKVAEACIEQGIHYIDLADGRGFVSGIERLNPAANEKGVLVISGASSVPCFTAALIDRYINEFETLDSLDYGITTAQRTTRGLATTSAILSYTGKAFNTPIEGEQQVVYGWQDLHRRKYKELGGRYLSNCDVPDLSLFPKRYPQIKTIRFYAGLELPFIHLSLWGLSWLVRMKLIHNLEKTASLLLSLSNWFDPLGSDKSGFHMKLSGKDNHGVDKTMTFELIARSGDGPYIPCVPAILLTKKLVNGELDRTGAFPCLGFISVDEYLSALNDWDISWQVD